jgi:hypothetical protein
VDELEVGFRTGLLLDMKSVWWVRNALARPIRMHRFCRTARLAIWFAIGPLLMVAGCQGNFGVMASQPAPGRVPFITEFKKIDAAGNGRITMDQAVDYYRRRFAELDKNGDGYLDMSELEAAIPLLTATSSKELMLKLDRNSDGKLSETEFLVIPNWLFQLAKSQTQLTLADVEKGK